MPSPQSALALSSSAKSPSPAAFIASAIFPGPLSWSRRHCIPTRSSGRIPICGAVVCHSSSFRHAIVTESAAMLPAIALSGSPSMPAVMTALGSMTSKAARTQSEVSWLSGAGPGTNPARKIRARVSSSRHPMYLVCLSGFSPIHSFSASDSSENIALDSSGWRGASLSPGAGVVVGAEVGGLVGVAVGAAVGFSVGGSVGTGVTAGVRVSGVGPEQAANAAMPVRMIRIAGMNGFSTGSSLFLRGIHSPFYVLPVPFLSSV